MSSIEDLKRQIEQLQRETEQAKARADQEKARADREAARNRKTTLEEYLQACHELLLSRIVLDTDGYLTSRVPSTKPTSKHCPVLLKPWGDEFFETQKTIFEKLAGIVPASERLFENIPSLETIGDRIHERPVRTETSLALAENNCLEDPVRIILSKLRAFDPETFDPLVYGGVYFERDASNLRDPSDGRDTTSRDEGLRTDPICVLRNGGKGPKDIAYVIEYKAPYKIHSMHFEQGLREMSIYDEVVTTKGVVPTAERARFRHYAEVIAAASVAQTYHYMLEAGLEYGYLTNGDAIVFLKIDWADPTELQYHLAQPAREVAANEDPVYANAVSQVLAFTLLALQSSQHDDEERNAAIGACNEWQVDLDYMLDEISRLEEEAQRRLGPTTPTQKKGRRVPSSPDWEPGPVKMVKRKPQPRTEPGPASSSGGGTGGGRGHGGGAGAEGSAGGSGSTSRSTVPVPPTQGSSSAPSRYGGSSSSSSSSSNSSNSGDKDFGGRSRQPRPYCTAACLLSLVNGWPLDRKCPNVLSHTQTGADGHADGHADEQKHRVSYAEWTALLRQQLSQSTVKGVVVLNREGACGALFQVTLLQYGYSFVAKGVTGRCVPALQKEQAVYQRLQPLQGRDIPVCLGSLDLRPLHQTVFYDIDVRIIYFLFLSHGGTALEMPADPTAQASITSTLTAVLSRMHALGVAHGDIRLPNVLRSATGQLTIIDFDRASILPAATCIPVSGISSHKRKRLMEDDESAPDNSGAMLDESSDAVQMWELKLTELKMREDILNASCLLAI